MSKNLVITLGIIFIFVIGIFFFFSSGSCQRRSGDGNQLSFTHMTLVTPPEAENVDWIKLEDIFRKRLYDLAEMRIFQISKDGSEVIVEITGANDPNITASLLITPLHVVIKAQSSEDSMLTSKDIEGIRSIFFDDELQTLGLYVRGIEDVASRLTEATSTATPENPITFDLIIDGKVFGTTDIMSPIQDNSLQFETPKDIDGPTVDMLSFMLSEELPFQIGVVVERSWFIPPRGKTETPIAFQDVIGKFLGK